MRRRQAFKTANPTKVLNRGVSDFLTEKSAHFGGNRVPPFLNWGFSGFFSTPYSQRLIGKFLDGRVVLAGGRSGFAQTDNPTADVHVFVADGTSFGSIAPLPDITNEVSIGSAEMATLGDGRILVAGGGVTGRDVVTLDPGTLTWTSRPAMTGSNIITNFTLTTLANGNILRVGGSVLGSPTDTVEEYVQGSNAWVTRGSLGSPRSGHTAVLTSNGKVLVAGGAGFGDTTTEIYDPTAHTWAPTTGVLQAGNEGNSSLTLSNGKSIFMCVVFSGSFTILADLYDPLTDNFTQLATLVNSNQSSGEGANLVEIGAGFVALVDADAFSRSSFYDFLKDEWTERFSSYPEPMAGTFTQITKNTMLIASGEQDLNYVRPHHPDRYITLSTLANNDLVPPTFGGLVSVEQGTSTDRVVLHWAAATDPKTHSEDINYLVYLSLTSGGQTFGPMGSEYSNTSAWAGTLSLELIGLAPDTDYYFVVRSIDMLGVETTVNESTLACNIDTNVVEILFHTALAIAAPTFSWTATDSQRTPRTDSRGLKLPTYSPFPSGDNARYMVLLGQPNGSTPVGGDIYFQVGTLGDPVPDSPNGQTEFVAIDGDSSLSDGQEARRPAVFGGVDTNGANVAGAAKYYPYEYSFNPTDTVHQPVPDMNEAVSRHAGVPLLVQDLLRIGGVTTAGTFSTATNTLERMNFHYCQTVNYDGLTVDFTVGQTLTGLTSGCTGIIRQITPADPTSGTMLVSDVTSFYTDTEEITDGDGGDAFANGFSSGSFVFQEWDFVSPMSNKRFWHSAINLDDGRVLVAGGINELNIPVRDIELYDPVADSWTVIFGVTLPYNGETSSFTVGEFVAGGTSGAYGLIGADNNTGATGTLSLSTLTGSFTNTEALSDTNVGFSYNSGSFNVGDSITGLSSGATGTVFAKPFDDTVNGILVVGSIAGGPFAFGETIASGGFASSGTITVGPTGTGVAAVNGTQTEVVRPHVQFPLIKLLDSRVMLVGGDQHIGGNSKIDIFDPSGPDTVSPGADLPNSRLRHTAHRFGDGQVGVFGGQDPSTGFGMNDVELYDPGADTWTNKASMLTARAGHTSFLLPNNTVLVVGGTDGSGTILASAEVSG